jgi:hypothetical protein
MSLLLLEEAILHEIRGLPITLNKGCVTLWPCIYIKKYLKAKEEL